MFVNQPLAVLHLKPINGDMIIADPNPRSFSDGVQAD
jgi:hypothetical protein